MLSRIARLEERLLQSEARFQNSPKPSAAVEESGYGSDTGTATRRPSTTFSASTTSLFSPELMSAGPSPAVINSPEMVSMAEETATEDRTPKKVHVTHAHSVWLWPATQDLLKESSPTAMSDLQYSEIRWLMRRQRPPWAASHSCRPEIETRASPDRGLVTMWFGLSYAQIVDLCNLYFNTFNFLYPFLDRGVFFSSTLPGALALTPPSPPGFPPPGFPQQGSQSPPSPPSPPQKTEEKTTVLLLVLALAHVAQEGSFGEAVPGTTGVRGGTKERPPGVEWFDAARRRLGFTATGYGLENVWISALVG
jgi:hypothetical protein